MIIAFDANEAPIVLEGWVTGPRRTLKVRLALDTGSTGTLIRATLLAGWVTTQQPPRAAGICGPQRVEQ